MLQYLPSANRWEALRDGGQVVQAEMMLHQRVELQLAHTCIFEAAVALEHGV